MQHRFLLGLALVAAAAAVAGCAGDGEAGGAGGSGGTAVVAQGGDVGVGPAAAGTGFAGITVVGTGTARAVPDTAEWSFGVQSDADTAAAALEAAGQATTRIVAALREAGVARADLQTEQVSLYPRTSDDGTSVIGYSASSSVHATVRELGRAGGVVDAAVRAGANQISGPMLRVDDSREQYRAAADAALDDARARAEALAARAGLTLGEPIAIVESGGAPPFAAEERALAADAAQSVPIEPGVNEIAATLTVTFAIA